MSITLTFQAGPLGRPRAWLAGACLVLAAACGGERGEPAATAPAMQELAGLNAEGEVVKLRVQAGAKPQTVAAGQACGVVVKGGQQRVCEAGSYCFKAGDATASACVASPGAPRSDE